MKSPKPSSLRSAHRSSRGAPLARRLRTLNDLTETLLEEVSVLVSGKSNPARLQAITNATGKFIASIRIRLEYAKQRGIKPFIPEIPETHQ